MPASVLIKCRSLGTAEALPADFLVSPRPNVHGCTPLRHATDINSMSFLALSWREASAPRFMDALAEALWVISLSTSTARKRESSRLTRRRTRKSIRKCSGQINYALHIAKQAVSVLLRWTSTSTAAVGSASTLKALRGPASRSAFTVKCVRSVQQNSRPAHAVPLRWHEETRPQQGMPTADIEELGCAACCSEEGAGI